VVEDFILVQQTYIDGELVAENGKSFVAHVPFETQITLISLPKKFVILLVSSGSKFNRREGQLITNEIHHQSLVVDGKLFQT
jgi:adenine deaminase